LTKRDDPLEYIFGYGSLLGDRVNGDAPNAEPMLCHLLGYRRGWNIAMDNRQTLPGYKYYIDLHDGSRPPVFVAFLNLVSHEGQAVNGIVFPVDAQELDALDERERNYERHEVTQYVTEGVGGRVWTYVGTADAEERFREGMRRGQVVVSREYMEGVLADFRAAGDDALQEFEASTDAPGCPVVDLERVDLE
jgi:cation transport regulator ChaC